jgi:hypothetical protein
MEDKKLFTIRECGKGPVVAGLENIPADNATLLRLALNRPVESLEIGEVTIGRRGSEAFEIVRCVDA